MKQGKNYWILTQIIRDLQLRNAMDPNIGRIVFQSRMKVARQSILAMTFPTNI